MTPTREVHLGWKLSRRHGVAFTINRETHHRAESCRIGELQVWDIVNRSPVDHPFHLHGFFFQVLEVNGRPPEFRSWEDTVNVPGEGVCGSHGCRMSGRENGCITATSWSTMRRA